MKKDAVHRSDEDQLDRLEGVSHCHRDMIRVHPIGATLPIESQRGQDGNDALAEQPLEHLDVHPLHLPGEQVIDTIKDPQGVGDDRVGGHGTKIVCREAFQDLMGETVGSGERELERVAIRDAGALEIAGSDVLLLGEGLDLRSGAVDDDHADIQGAEDRDVLEEARKDLVHHHGCVDAQDEGLLSEARNVL